MRVDAFRKWMQDRPMNPKPIKDCISRCRKVEKSIKNDLDIEFEKDRGVSLMKTLTYGMQEIRNNQSIPQGFTFKQNANLRFRFTDLRSAVKKYFEFCECARSDSRG